MRTIVLVAALAACGGDDGTGFPIMPGGGGSGSSSMPDASIGGDEDGGSTLTGRVCLVSDARRPTTCAGSGADGLTVTVGGSTATTAADGSFSLTRPSG